MREPVVKTVKGPAVSRPTLRVAEPGENIQVGTTTEVHVRSAIHRGDYPVADAFNVLLVTWTDKRLKGPPGFVCCLATSTATSESSDANKAHILQVPASEIYRDFHAVTSMEYVLYSCLVFPANPNTTTTMEKEQRAFSGGDTEKKETSEWTDYRYVAFAENSCSVDMTSVAHEISERVKPRGEGEGGVAICAKTAYGKIDPRLLVEWFELAKIVGVSVVQVVYHEIPDNMLAVFRYYEKTGFVVLASITPAALKGDPPRHFKRPRDELQAWGDGRVVTNECLHRLGRHDYVFVSDFDELLLPSNPFTSLPQMLREAGQMYPSAGLFRVESHIVALNWDEVEPANPVLFLRHRRRSVSNTLDSKGVGKSSPKVIVRPQRVSYVGTHLAKVKKGYTQVDLPVSLHTFLHYRSWKPMLWGTNTTRMAAVNGTEVLRFEPQWLQALSELPLKSMGCDESYASGIALAAKRADHGKH